MNKSWSMKNYFFYKVVIDSFFLLYHEYLTLLRKVSDTKVGRSFKGNLMVSLSVSMGATGYFVTEKGSRV